MGLRSDDTAGMARRNKNQNADINVPDITEDAVERKRVLNVLAQRRYRKRKREQFQALQSQVNDKMPTENIGFDEHLQQPNAGHVNVATIQVNDTQTMEEATARSSPDVLIQSVSGLMDFEFMDLQSQMSSSFPGLPDPALMTWLPPLDSSFPASDLSTTNSSENSNSDSFFSFFNSNTTDSSSSTLPSADLASSLQDRQTSIFSFPDDHLLTVLELDLLRGCLRIAQRLGCDQYIWNLEAMSPFFGAGHSSQTLSDPSFLTSSFRTTTTTTMTTEQQQSTTPGPSSSSTNLPTNLIPTRTQRQLPHHPILDILPWPTARDKLISVFSQPVELRPPVAADSMSLVQLVYDMEDSAEGLRIWGPDPFDGELWEVGQVFFERWWWALDAGIVGKSNEWRVARGARKLRLPGMGFDDGDDGHGST